MIRAELVPPVPMEPTVKIELPRRQAIILRAIVGGIAITKSEAGDFINDLYDALVALPGVGDEGKETFSDFFCADKSGYVQCK